MKAELVNESFTTAEEILNRLLTVMRKTSRKQLVEFTGLKIGRYLTGRCSIRR